MSRWTHGTVANSRRNRPLFTSEPSTVPEFTMSPYQLSMSLMYSSTSGICQKRSPARAAATMTSSYQPCGVPNPPATR